MELCRRLEDRGLTAIMVDFLDAAPRSGSYVQKVFRLWLRWTPWAYELAYRSWVVLPWLYGPMSMLLTAVFGKRLERWIARTGADAVVSTYPFASVVLGRLKRKNRISVPIATFMTDFSIHPLWLGRGMDLHLCVHPLTAAAASNITEELTLAPGPMVAAAYRGEVPCKHEARLAMGIPQEKTVVLVTAGSWGVGQIEATLNDLARTGDHYFVLIACGKNEKLKQRIARRSSANAMAIGWTDQMPQLMAAADVLVQNAGGLTAMEAFAVGLPVITYRPIPGHGRDNARAMEKAGVAPYAKNTTQLASALAAATSGLALHALRAQSIFAADSADHIAQLPGLQSNRIDAPIATESPSECEHVPSAALLATTSTQEGSSW